jgi:hypothetical protein
MHVYVRTVFPTVHVFTTVEALSYMGRRMPFQLFRLCKGSNMRIAKPVEVAFLHRYEL